MSSQKNNLLFVFLIVVIIFAIAIVDANNYSNTEQSIPQPTTVDYQTQAPCGQSSGGCQVSPDSNSNSNNVGGSCCSTGSADLSVDDVESAALAYYVNTYGDSDVTIKVNDYGCHQEIEVIKDGNVIMTLGYNGEVYEL
ncbi:MAG: hypothetical protein P1P69_05660 [Methanosarcinaceae archaeon]|nr:hypothetical protein [Methanosarcinaceae archaeon]